jgi:hypothetical protein
MLAIRALTLIVALAASALAANRDDRTITKVVKLLQGLLDKSKEDGSSERELYAKYKCYCDTQTEEKTMAVEDLTTDIGLLENKIEGLQGSNGALSAESAQLQASIAANELARSEAQALRTKAKANFDAEEADLTSAISQMGTAIDVLADIGSDQTLQAAADHGKFMANYGAAKDAALLKLRGSMKQALLAAQTFLTSPQKRLVESFLARDERRAPFTGTYTAQSGNIVGILKQMRDTFDSNLNSSRVTEAAAVTAHASFMETKLEEHGTLSEAYNTKQATLGTNDGELGSKKQQLNQAIEDKASAESFLEQLSSQCAEKSKDYDQRNLLRTNEEAAIAKAIAILNSDQAFQAFSKVQATSTGATGFVQLQSIRRHVPGKNLNGTLLLQRAQSALRPCAAWSKRVRGLMTMLQVGNPFERVLAEMAKMHTVIDEEAAVDKEQLDWCTTERTQNNEQLTSKTTQIDTLGGDIDTLTTSIDDPQTGLKKQITDTEDGIDANSKSQKVETEERRDAHKVYATSINDIVEAEALLTKAVTVLKKYYKTLEDEYQKELSAQSMTQLKKEEPSPPETWSGDYAGQSDTGKSAVDMLEFILQETTKEEQAAHTSEAEGQKLYEDSMATLMQEATDLGTALVSLKKTLSEKELELGRKHEELGVTTKEKVAIERYLEQIKPGCDFITTNFDLRESNRGEEKAALTRASGLISASPAYTAAVAAAEEAALGDCAPLCAGSNATHVQCKACSAGVSEPGYCASHPGTNGC